eukprot:GHVS01025987.1.p1 GENE.GHVS01025987.1~~GHVS01025987.1.p1  ORF type:complete len:622 (-),score=130.91 GHVS01025987.1:474-2339(-)
MNNTSLAALCVETHTWVRDSHDLFDYEANTLKRKLFYLTRAAKAFRSNTDVSILKEGDPFPTLADYLFSVKLNREGKYLIFPAERNLGGPQSGLNPKKLWTIVKELPEKNYSLQENDVIKLGRFKLRVKQLVRAGDVVPEVKLDDCDTPITAASSEEMILMQCRICLLEGNQEDDPLICPCQCRGSIKFVHVECLRHWVNGKINITDDQRNTFFFRQIQCELCKTVFPSSINFNSEKIQIVKVPTTEPPFIVLENLVGNSQRGVHVISMAEKKDLKLGRGHESDVRIPDVSISRYHATIRFVGDCFQLSDNDSKFGTLVAMRKAQAIEKDETMSIQVGRSMVQLSVDQGVPADACIKDVSDTLAQNEPATDGSTSDTNGEPSNEVPPGDQQRGNTSMGEERSQEVVGEVPMYGVSRTTYLQAIGREHPHDGGGRAAADVLMGGEPTDTANTIDPCRSTALPGLFGSLVGGGGGGTASSVLSSYSSSLPPTGLGYNPTVINGATTTASSSSSSRSNNAPAESSTPPPPAHHLSASGRPPPPPAPPHSHSPCPNNPSSAVVVAGGGGSYPPAPHCNPLLGPLPFAYLSSTPSSEFLRNFSNDNTPPPPSLPESSRQEEEADQG